MLAKDMANLMLRTKPLEQCAQNNKKIVLIPVPQDKKRVFQKGFNQSQALAENLSRLWHKPIKVNYLTKIKSTRSQASIKNREERQENLKAAFGVNGEGVETLEKSVDLILVDDNLTTGATLIACAQTLKGAGFKSISAITWSKKLRSLNNKKS